MLRLLLGLALLLALAAPARAQGGVAGGTQPTAPAGDPRLVAACKAETKEAAAALTAVAIGRAGSVGLRNLAQEELRARFVPDGGVQRLQLPLPGNASADDYDFTAILLPVPAGPIELRAADTIAPFLLRHGIGTLHVISNEHVARTTAPPVTPASARVQVVLPALNKLWLLPWWDARMIAVLGCPREATKPPVLATGVWEVSNGLTALPLALGAFAALWWLAARTSPAAGRMREAAGKTRNTLWWRSWLDPVVIGADPMGHGSLSRTQILFFSSVVVVTLAYTFARVGFLSDISEQLLYLLGVAGLGTASARLISDRQGPEESRLTEATLRWLRVHEAEPKPRDPDWKDLLVTDGQFDIYKFQSVALSGLVGLYILFAGFHELAALTIPDRLMILLGLSQAVYVGGKALTGPVRAAEMAALNAAVTRAAEAGQALRAAVAKLDPPAPATAPGDCFPAEALDRVAAERDAFAAAEAEVRRALRAAFGLERTVPLRPRA